MGEMRTDLLGIRRFSAVTGYTIDTLTEVSADAAADLVDGFPPLDAQKYLWVEATVSYSSGAHPERVASVPSDWSEQAHYRYLLEVVDGQVVRGH